jgi:Cu(I)-responsive transcriptional regulator
MKAMTVGELAKRADVGIETIRYYEKQGLLDQPVRKESGYRLYDDDTVHALQFIRRAKELGFTLKQIKSLMALPLQTGIPRSEVRQQAIEKVAEIDAKIADLSKMRDSLRMLVDQCHGNGSVDGCPIMNALQGVEWKDCPSRSE